MLTKRQDPNLLRGALIFPNMIKELCKEVKQLCKGVCKGRHKVSSILEKSSRVQLKVNLRQQVGLPCTQ